MTSYDQTLAQRSAQLNMAVEGGKRDYGKVVISLENVVLPEEKLIQTPSRIDGLDEEVEIDLRIVGCEYIQMAGILLKLPQVRIRAILVFTFAAACLRSLCN